ncbi:MAG: hypothetical protein KF745_12985 [Phycisphaeraceae bacterium]|nr:hypothetical protein [Phycisphaeraceae bacterium]
MKTCLIAALCASVGLATNAMAQVSVRKTVAQSANQVRKDMQKVKYQAVQPDVVNIMAYPDGYVPPASDLRAVQVVYDNTNTGTVYAYSAQQVPALFNPALEAVTMQGWTAGSPITTLSIGVRKMIPASRTFKIFVRIWDNVNAAAAPGTDVKSVQLGPDMFFTNGGAGFTVSGQYTVGFNLAMPAGIIPADSNIGVEIRMINNSVTTTADAALLANLDTSMGCDIMSTQSALGGTFPPPNAPSIGTPYPADGVGHYWFDNNVAAAAGQAQTFQDGQFWAGDTNITFYEDVYDTDAGGQNWGNVYLRVSADIAGIPPPVNNNCTSATVVTMPGGAPSTVTIANQTTLGATTDAPVPPACGVGIPATQQGVWYSFTGRGKVTTASTCGPGAFDSVVAVYSGGCAAPVCVAGADDAGLGCSTNLDAGTATFCAANGVPYLIYVRPFDGVTGGNFSLVVTEESTNCPAAACTLNATGATDLTGLNPTCGVPSSPFGTCATSQTGADCTTYFDSITRGDDGLGGNVRGVDAFLYTAVDTSFTVAVNSEFAGILFMLESGDPFNPCAAFLVASPGQANFVTCVPYSRTVSGVTPGDTFLVQIAPMTFGPAGAPACGAQGTHYRIKFSSPLCPPEGPDCFNRTAPQQGGFFVAGGADGTADNTQCVGDWDRNNVVEPADIAQFIQTWNFAVSNPGTPAIYADVDCNGLVEPSDIAVFIQYWVGGTTPGNLGCP